MTMGAPCRSTYGCALSGSAKLADAAVGMPCRCINALAKAFELSSCAQARVGPKIRSPRAEQVNNAGCKRRFGADDREIDRFPICKIRERAQVSDGNRNIAHARLEGRAAVSGSYIHALHARR